MSIKTFFARLFGLKEKTGLRIYNGDGTWCFYAQDDGNGNVRLFERRTHNSALEATWYGGTNDPFDSGKSASGVHTKNYPKLEACALPMDLLRTHNNPCKGSPLPVLPWGTVARSDGTYNLSPNGTYVRVTNVKTGVQLTLPLNDLGPAKSASNAIDLTQAAYVKLAGARSARLLVQVTIINGTNLIAQSYARSRK